MIVASETDRLLALIDEAITLADAYGLASAGIWLDRARVSVTEVFAPVVEACDDPRNCLCLPNLPD